MKLMAKCHPLEMHRAFGLCNKCYMKRYRTTESYKIKNRAHAAKFRSTEYGKKYNKEYQLKYRYGISAKDFYRMFDKQKGKCLICFNEKELVVDHCHTTKFVRGLICQGCNTLVGYLETKKHLVERAMNYIQEYKEPITSELNLNLIELMKNTVEPYDHIIDTGHGSYAVTSQEYRHWLETGELPNVCRS